MDAIHFNHVAALLIQEGKYKKASLTLRQGLKSLAKSFKLTSTHRTVAFALNLHLAPGRSASRGSQDKRDGQCKAKLVIHTCQTPDITAAELAHCPVSLFSIFNRIFVISIVENDEETKLVEVHSEAIVAVILFNLGLTLHHQAVKTSSSHFWGQSLKFYVAALHALKESSIQDHLARLLSMAIANNMGHIYSNLFDERKTCECRELLKSLLSSQLTLNGDWKNELDFFFLAAFYVGAVHTAHSPAA